MDMETKKTNHITTIKTTKFRTTLIKVAFTAPLMRETVTARNLLADVLANSSQNFASKKALSAHLEDLYGASLSVTTKKQGQTHAISFYLQVVNEKFLKSAQPLFTDALQVLGEVIMNPKINNHSFDAEIVTLEKRLLKEEIESVYDDKTTYALRQLQQKMCATERFATIGDGYAEDLASITPQTLVTTYENMISKDAVIITIIGDVEHDEVVRMVTDNFDLNTNMRNELAIVDLEEKTIETVAEFTEQQLINQAKLNIGYRINTRITEADYFATLIFNGVFGGHASSKLFTNVREKESLCYYVGSQIDSFKGLMYVYSGLDLTQIPKALTIIEAQLTDIQNGNVTAQELQLAKNHYINAKRSALDSASGMLADLETSLLLDLTTEEFIDNLQNVTLAEVQLVANKIKKDTIFILEPMTKAEVND